MRAFEPDGRAACGAVAAAVNDGDQVRSQFLNNHWQGVDQLNADVASAAPVTGGIVDAVQSYLDATHTAAVSGQSESQSAPNVFRQCCGGG
jgi:hypothetical protein